MKSSWKPAWKPCVLWLVEKRCATWKPLSASFQTQYTKTLEDAYAALAKVETIVDELGQELEYHHERLGKAMEPDRCR
jgi:hypothetical protein